MGIDTAQNQRSSDRREKDRRQQVVNFSGEDKRKANRRSGADRRRTPRH